MKTIHIYHPNKSVKGFACSFWQSNRDGCLFATLIKQSGWDEKNKIGLFKGSINDPTKKVNIKLSDIEACAILDCIERNRPFSSFHTSENTESPKSISFQPWMMNVVADEGEATPKPVQKGYSFSVVIGGKSNEAEKNSFYIGLTFAEARLIREFIIHCLHVDFRQDFPDKYPDTEGPKTSSETPEKSVKKSTEKLVSL